MIRPMDKHDRAAVRAISVATAMVGEPADRFFDGDDFLADALTIYFTDFEPESCFVAEMDDRVVGYVIGSKDTVRMDRIFSREIFWPLLRKAFTQGIFFRFQNWCLLMRILICALRGGYNIPDLAKEYPATLHINILKGYRHSGIGSQLMIAFLKYLQKAKVRGVRMGTMSNDAGHFFQKHGFSRIFADTRPYFRDALKKDVPLYIYARKLT